MVIEKIQANLSGDLRPMGGRKFLFYPEGSPVIVQLEALENDRLLMYCSFARDGSGLFLASFMTLLLTEDVGAISPLALPVDTALSCVTGSVSQTYFRLMPDFGSRLSDMQKKTLAATCVLFAEEMRCKSADLINASPLSDDRLPSCNLADFRIAHLMENLDEA
ncbi:MAG: hypothetical protein ACPG7D_05240 [Candidatus Puniceispirillaceae bacterium]